MLATHGLDIAQSSDFGMHSNNPRLLYYAVPGLVRCLVAALRCYNWLFSSLSLLKQSPLLVTPGLIDLTGVYELLLVCERRKPS